MKKTTAATAEITGSVEKPNSKAIPTSSKEDTNTLSCSTGTLKFETISTKTPEANENLNSKLEIIEPNS